MISFTSTATLVDADSLDEGAWLEATLDRAELEGLLGSTEAPQLWFDLASENEAPQRMTLELTDADLRALLEGADGEELTLALDAQALADALEEPDVEAHGMRTGIAIAVALVAGAAAAPSALAATPQVSSAAKPQVTKGAVASQQVSRQVVRSEVHTGRTSPVKFRQLSVLRAGTLHR